MSLFRAGGKSIKQLKYFLDVFVWVLCNTFLVVYSEDPGSLAKISCWQFFLPQTSWSVCVLNVRLIIFAKHHRSPLGKTAFLTTQSMRDV